MHTKSQSAEFAIACEEVRTGLAEYGTNSFDLQLAQRKNSGKPVGMEIGGRSLEKCSLLGKMHRYLARVILNDTVRMQTRHVNHIHVCGELIPGFEYRVVDAL